MKKPTIDQSSDWIRARDPKWESRSLALVLGSGWSTVVDHLMEVEGSANYRDIPGFSNSTAPGHEGKLFWGRIEGCPVYCMQGRFHYYEGYNMERVTWPIRVFSDLGIKGLVLTNAAGGIMKEMVPGQLMIIRDHINFMGINPLLGPNQKSFGPRFIDMTRAYDPEFQKILIRAGGICGQRLKNGVYLAVSGPSFETPAEIEAFRRLGADAVGMSTVPECLVARHCGMRVAGISCITNMAAHTHGPELSHTEFSTTAAHRQEAIAVFLGQAIPDLFKALASKVPE